MHNRMWAPFSDGLFACNAKFSFCVCPVFCNSYYMIYYVVYIPVHEITFSAAIYEFMTLCMFISNGYCLWALFVGLGVESLG